MKLLSEVFKSVKKKKKTTHKKQTKQPNKTHKKTCHLVSDLDVVGGF